MVGSYDGRLLDNYFVDDKTAGSDLDSDLVTVKPRDNDNGGGSGNSSAMDTPSGSDLEEANAKHAQHDGGVGIEIALYDSLDLATITTLTRDACICGVATGILLLGGLLCVFSLGSFQLGACIVFAGLCMFLFGSLVLDDSDFVSWTNVLSVAAGRGLFLHRLRGVVNATDVLCGITRTGSAGVDLTKIWFVFARRIRRLFSRFHPGWVVVFGVLWGVAKIGGFGHPHLFHPGCLVAPFATDCLLMEGRQPWGRDARVVGRSDIGVCRPVTSAIAGGDICINVNSGAVGSTHLVMEALLRAISTDAWITCHNDDG